MLSCVPVLGREARGSPGSSTLAPSSPQLILPSPSFCVLLAEPSDTPGTDFFSLGPSRLRSLLRSAPAGGRPDWGRGREVAPPLQPTQQGCEAPRTHRRPEVTHPAVVVMLRAPHSVWARITTGQWQPRVLRLEKPTVAGYRGSGRWSAEAGRGRRWGASGHGDRRRDPGGAEGSGRLRMGTVSGSGQGASPRVGAGWTAEGGLRGRRGAED